MLGNGAATKNPNGGIRETLEARRRLRDESSYLRAASRPHEEALREWEEQVRTRPPKGRRWKTVLGDCKKEISPSTEIYVKLLRGEQEAYHCFQSALEQVAELNGRSPLEPAVVDLLKECFRLQGLEIQWVEEALKISQKISMLRSEVPADKVLTLLDLRRRYLNQVVKLRQDGLDVENRIAEIANGTAPLPAPSEDAPPDDGHDDPDEEIADEDPLAALEEEIEMQRTVVDRIAEEQTGALARLADAERRYREEAVRRREESREREETLEARIAELEAERDRLAAESGERAERIEELTRERDKRTAELEAKDGEIAELTERFEADLATAEERRREAEESGKRRAQELIRSFGEDLSRKISEGAAKLARDALGQEE